jgi:cardiolipin synthase A/B
MHVPIWLLAVLLLAIVALSLIVWSVKRRRRMHLKLGPIDDLGDLMRSIAGVTQGSLIEGNRIELLENGRFFDVLFPELQQAKSSVHLETFLSKEGEVTRKLAAILSERARAGVEVRVMLDGSGGKTFGKAGLKEMTGAGCRVQHYHRIRLANLGRINNRTHRKIVIVDGRIGYVGGHCMVDSWLGDAQDKEHFRDVTARIEGPIVAQLQSAFSDNWIEECGEVITGEHIFPELKPAGPTTGHVVFVSPTGTTSTLKLLHNLAIKAARKRIRIQNPYFLPDPDARDALVEAVKRGVDVRVMLPATEASDSPIVQHASHHHYGTLLKGGVKLYDYQRTLLHQKVFVVDGEWSSIGSTNFDDRSFEINDEISLVTYDKGVAAELERIFEEDLKLSRQRTIEEWQRRPATHKLLDFTAFLFNEQL